MKHTKFLSYVALALIIAGCKSIANIPVPKGTTTPIVAVAKKSPLTETQKQQWGHFDLVQDSIPGISLDKAYIFLQGKKGVEVVVAVADSGIDVEHEDLKGVAWVNPKEIPGNKLDDDKNGYVDDIHGWNFLGSADGSIIVADQLEITRLTKKGMDTFGDKKPEDIDPKDKAAYEQYLKYKEEYMKSSVSRRRTSERIKELDDAFAAVKGFLKKESFTADDLKMIKTDNVKLAAQIADIANLLSRGLTEEGFIEFKTTFEKEKHYDLDFNRRETLVEDDLYDIKDAYYGNNNVIGSKDDEYHGSHVAGIIGADRTNTLGMKGVANNVKIMAVRVVPDGDEHDKDVALGIRYAVDNGAKIINTSFGKAYSPNKQWVFDAIKYAAEKDVLIVNAAGNDGKDIDVEKTYPNDSEDLMTEIADNVLTIGAMSANYNQNLPASFTNYGQRNVDVFAPGVAIYSTFTKDKYGYLNGTSMAAPSAAGVAALIRSYYPKLTASQVKHILMNSGTLIDLEVVKPGSVSRTNPKGELVPFSKLSVSGRVINAYNALMMAEKMVNGK